MTASRTLILMRHAAAGHEGATRDHDRPLTAGGVRDAAVAGAWITEHVPAVDAVLCSTALRTRQTLSATRISAPSAFLEQLYGGGVDDILEEIALVPAAASTVLVIGHAPSIPATAAELVTIAAMDNPSPDGELDGDVAGTRILGGGPTEKAPGVDELRHFSASSIAVLRTQTGWADLRDLGAVLVAVRHPDR